MTNRVRLPPELGAFAAFGVQVIIGAVTFSIIYTVALAVAAGVHYLNLQLGAPSWLKATGAIVEAVIFIGDMTGLLFLLVAEIVKLAYRPWTEWRELHG